MFPSTSSRQTGLSEKQNELFPSGSDIKCIIIYFHIIPWYVLMDWVTSLELFETDYLHIL